MRESGRASPEQCDWDRLPAWGIFARKQGVNKGRIRLHALTGARVRDTLSVRHDSFRRFFLTFNPMTPRSLKSILSASAAVAICVPLTSCDTFQNMSDGFGNRAGSMAFWKKDKNKDSSEKKKRFWKRDKGSDEYTLAGGSLPDNAAEEQKLLEAAERAADQGRNVMSEAPDRIDLNSPVVGRDAPTIDIPQPQPGEVPERLATAPSYEASSRTDPPVRPSFSNSNPRLPTPEPNLPAPANSSTPGGRTNPDIPAPREKDPDEYIRLLPPATHRTPCNPRIHPAFAGTAFSGTGKHRSSRRLRKRPFFAPTRPRNVNNLRFFPDGHRGRHLDSRKRVRDAGEKVAPPRRFLTASEGMKESVIVLAFGVYGYNNLLIHCIHM